MKGPDQSELKVLENWSPISTSSQLLRKHRTVKNKGRWRNREEDKEGLPRLLQGPQKSPDRLGIVVPELERSLIGNAVKLIPKVTMRGFHHPQNAREGTAVQHILSKGGPTAGAPAPLPASLWLGKDRASGLIAVVRAEGSCGKEGWPQPFL